MRQASAGNGGDGTDAGGQVTDQRLRYGRSLSMVSAPTAPGIPASWASMFFSRTGVSGGSRKTKIQQSKILRGDWLIDFFVPVWF